MVSVEQQGARISINTDRYAAGIDTEGYVSGVAAGTFIDKSTGAKDPGYGLMIIDFLLEPGLEPAGTPKELHYLTGDGYHGDIVKRYVALPQICTQAKKLDFRITRGAGYAAVTQWFTWNIACPPYPAGSRWEQTLLFPDGRRWFMAWDRFQVAEPSEAGGRKTDTSGVALRMDMPCHVKHGGGDVFDQIYLSYEPKRRGLIPQFEFHQNFPPQQRFLYRRGHRPPEQYVRAIKLTNGPWLAGIALKPSVVYEAWCHQRDYVCMIQEVSGNHDAATGWRNSLHLVGWFDTVEEMHAAAQAHRGATQLTMDTDGWQAS